MTGHSVNGYMHGSRWLEVYDRSQCEWLYARVKVARSL